MRFFQKQTDFLGVGEQVGEVVDERGEIGYDNKIDVDNEDII